MKIAIHKWVNLDMNRYRNSILRLKEEEWTLVDDLLNILQPFLYRQLVPPWRSVFIKCSSYTTGLLNNARK